MRQYGKRSGSAQRTAWPDTRSPVDRWGQESVHRLPNPSHHHRTDAWRLSQGNVCWSISTVCRLRSHAQRLQRGGVHRASRHPDARAMTSIIRSQAADVPYNMTTTGFDLSGYEIVANLGVVRGVVVRSRSIFGTFGAGMQTIFGGNITLFTDLAERTRQQAFDTMLVQADVAGADAVIGIRYDATEVMSGVTEVICYGTAVRVQEAVAAE